MPNDMVSSVYPKVGKCGMVMDSMEQEGQEQKRRFATCMINGMDKNKAAFEVFPTDSKNRMIAMLDWEKDPVVVNMTREILGIPTEAATHMTSKEEHIEELYSIFRDGDIAVKDRLVASEQITRMQGFIQDKKEQTTVNNKIMIVTSSGSDAEWADKTRRNQENLMNGIVEVKAIEVRE